MYLSNVRQAERGFSKPIPYEGMGVKFARFWCYEIILFKHPLTLDVLLRFAQLQFYEKILLIKISKPTANQQSAC